MCLARRVRGSVEVLHDEKFKVAQQTRQLAAGNPGMRCVGGDDPESLDPAVMNARDNLIVGPGVLRRNAVDWNAQCRRDFLPVSWVLKIVSAQQARRVCK